MTTTELHAIDWPLCLARGNHQPEFARELLSMLVKELPNYSKQIQKAYEQEDRVLLSHHLQKLHSACCYSGIPQLQQMLDEACCELDQHKKLPSAESIAAITQHIKYIIDDARKIELEIL